MKKLILLFCFSVSFSLYGQDINGGFETWKSSGQAAPFNWFEPEGWGTTNPRTQVTFAGVRKSTDRKSGTLGAELNTVNLFGKLSPTIISIGKLQIDFITGVYYYRLNSGGIKLEKNPNAIKFWYKYKSNGANDVGLARVFVKRFDQVGNKSTILFNDSISLQKVDIFTEKTLNIDFPTFNTQTDSIGILFYSGIDGRVEGNGVLVVDDLEIITTSSTNHSEIAEINVFPNPVQIGNVLTIDASELSTKLDELFIYNEYGKFLHKMDYQSNKGLYELSTSGYKPGVYFIRGSHGDIVKKFITLK